VRRRLDSYVGKISYVGNSLLVYLPKKVVEELKLRRGQYVKLMVQDGKIVVEPLNIEELEEG
jgi:antitoxin component of MazEF toxin-antitoxin module